MKTKRFLLAAAFIGLPLASHAQWTYQYEGDVLPAAATPAWNNGGSAPSGFSTDGFILTQNTTLGQDSWFRMDPPYWNASSQFGRFEFRARTLSLASGATEVTRVTFGSTTRYWELSMRTNSVILGASVAPVDTSVFHTYLVELSGTQASLWIDGDQAASSIWGASALNNLYFGDLDGSFTGGVAEWDYLYWTNVPEPASALLLGVAGLLLWRRRIRNG